MQIAVTLKPDDRTNPHSVPGHSHVVRDALEPKDATGFGQHGGLGKTSRARSSSSRAAASSPAPATPAPP